MIEDSRQQELIALGTSTLSDALDSLGIHGQCLGLTRRSGGAIAGTAFTVQYRSVGENGGTVGDYIDDVGRGQIVVIANTGRSDVTVWGELLTFAAVKGGVGGTVIDGAARDLESVAAQSYPLYSTASHMRTGKDRVFASAFRVDVEVAGVAVHPGDYVVGDRDGVICISKTRVDEVTARAREIADREAAILDLLKRGSSLRAAREKLGYHMLQRGSKDGRL